MIKLTVNVAVGGRTVVGGLEVASAGTLAAHEACSYTLAVVRTSFGTVLKAICRLAWEIAAIVVGTAGNLVDLGVAAAEKAPVVLWASVCSRAGCRCSRGNRGGRSNRGSGGNCGGDSYRGGRSSSAGGSNRAGGGSGTGEDCSTNDVCTEYQLVYVISYKLKEHTLTAQTRGYSSGSSSGQCS